ncbi:alpha/beta fold hydrolase [Actinomadura algeriensis]|uniref:Pimeloyl-ACP methyl ester carboxylesterase n=1 Tax=Actinomadura algeriensis TaxID=1679523 RepID=A0ABR9K593_9ACTN|nr:alpha/beta hydrolase [Actinomadura algeriensis]MBE1537996.1 pimeloyl-ACP methyl ester carboxylesterase [Actinomadura algeriensis]
MNASAGPSPSTHVVPSGGVDLAVRDHGGDGPAIVLLHGGGRTMDDWRLVVPRLLATGLRVVTADLRGHGASAPALWAWTDTLDDLAAVIDHRGLDRPAVVGHSLGGIIAALWAARHSECPLAVNLDGHTNPTGPFDLEPAAARAAEATMRGFLDAEVRRSGDPAAARLIEELGALDLLATYRAARCPLIVVASTGTGVEELLPPEVADVFRAYRRGFARELAAAEASTPPLSVVDVPTGHDVHLEAPDRVADLILERLLPRP